MRRIWLIVEDDPVIRAILTAMTTHWEIVPQVFRDGHEASAWLDEVEHGAVEPPFPEIALLDLRMPGPSGEEIAQRLRGNRVTGAIPIVLMTAYHLSDEQRDRLEASVRPNLIISKPLPSSDELRRMFDRTIAESSPKVQTQKINRKAVEASKEKEKEEQERGSNRDPALGKQAKAQGPAR